MSNHPTTSTPNRRFSLLSLLHLILPPPFLCYTRTTITCNSQKRGVNRYASGTINKIPDGVKVVSVTRGGSALTEPIHLEVSQASSAAIAAVEAVGGTVTCVHFNKLAMRALLKPYKFQLLPRRARPQPKLMPYYLDHTRCGFLSPEIQKRNLKMFGAVTSEEKCRQEHTNFMDKWREELRAHRRQLLDDAGMESPVV